MMDKDQVQLICIHNKTQLENALRRPVHMEDHLVFLTDDLTFIRELAAAGLPCIFHEKQVHADCTVDLIWQGDMLPDEETLLQTWQRHYHIPWTIAQTEEYLLRESIPEDLPALLNIYEQEKDNPDIIPFGEDPEEEFLSYITHRYPFYGYGLWTLVDKRTGQVIGRMGLEDIPEGVELAYILDRSVRGCGVAKRMCEEILHYAREMELTDVYLRTREENTASLKLAKKLGFLEKKWGLYMRSLKSY